MAGSWVVFRVLFAPVITIRRRRQRQPINSRMVKTGPGHLTLLNQTHGMSVCHRNVQVSRRVIFSTATGRDIQRGHGIDNASRCCFASGSLRTTVPWAGSADDQNRATEWDHTYYSWSVSGQLLCVGSVRAFKTAHIRRYARALSWYPRVSGSVCPLNLSAGELLLVQALLRTPHFV